MTKMNLIFKFRCLSFLKTENYWLQKKKIPKNTSEKSTEDFVVENVMFTLKQKKSPTKRKKKGKNFVGI